MKPDPTAVPATTGTTVEYQVRFATGPKGARRMKAAGETARTVKAPPTPTLAPPPRPAAPAYRGPDPVLPRPTSRPALPVVGRPSATAAGAAVPEQPDSTTAASRVPKITLLLVLGHYFEHLVRDGAIRDYAEIARRTGLTRGRVTQIVNLTLLAPEIQEAILDMNLTAGDDGPVHERTLRAVVAEQVWSGQQGLSALRR